jgi:DNA-binding phage protein
MARRKTAFDRDLAQRLEDPEFATEYYSAKQELAESAALVRQLDEARTRHRMSKATLARRAAISPETVRKLFTAGGNPEIRTVARLAAPLGLRLLLAKRPAQPARRASRQNAARVAR